MRIDVCVQLLGAQELLYITSVPGSLVPWLLGSTDSDTQMVIYPQTVARYVRV